ncbi:hypothetical protein CBS101457_004486 [Exobasidium rhododendri]|nr:hypothetical protein CBS101457_004486 [Exobasidium rhododendri]
MQSVPSVEHIWSSPRGKATPGDSRSAPRFDRIETSPNVPSTNAQNDELVDLRRRENNNMSANAGTPTINDGSIGSSSYGNLQQTSPRSPRLTSPSYFRHAKATGSENVSPIDSILFPVAAKSGGSEYIPAPRPNAQQMSSSGSIGNIIGSSLTASNSNEDFFSQRDPVFLPRRNHTIGAGATSSRRRISQFQFPRPAPTSPGQNSLSAITGGEDAGDDDWEKMIKSREKLVPGEDDRDELSLANESDDTRATASAWPHDSSVFSTSHRRFPSQPTSVQGTSPFISGSHSPVAHMHHQRSESAHVNSLEYGPFASASTIQSMNSISAYGKMDAGMIRRHQSLNHASSKSMGSRLHGSRRNREYENNDATISNVMLGTERPLPPQSISPGPPISGKLDTGGLSPTPEGDSSMSSSNFLSSDLMDAHARLARMSIQPSQLVQPTRDGMQVADGKRALSSLITNQEVLQRSASFNPKSKRGARGPVSASAYVQPIGHAHHRRNSSSSGNLVSSLSRNELPSTETTNNPPHHPESFSALPSSASWAPFGVLTSTESSVTGEQQPFATSTTRVNGMHQNIPLSMPSKASLWNEAPPPNNRTIDSTALQIAMLQQRLHHQQQQQATWQTTQQHPRQHQAMHNTVHAVAIHNEHHNLHTVPGARHAPQINSYGAAISTLPDMGLPGAYSSAASQSALPRHIAAPPIIDPSLSALIAVRGFNPPPSQYAAIPNNARFFVIKSFTEDDVHRSLKHEIWASTDKGNQRLDKAFRDMKAEGRGPLYLFFSVNASGHFCGMAQMLTAVDYNSTSNVWVQEGKWKGTFKVRWIYVKDVPNGRLRHLRLTNTPEQKPITQSRDTQELPIEGGKEMLKIMAEFPSKTTLLQDWLFYEQQATQQQGQALPVNSGSDSTAPGKVHSVSFPAAPLQAPFH